MTPLVASEATAVTSGNNCHPMDSPPERTRARLRAKLSYTNVGFALAPEEFTISELREIYRAALGHDVSATNLQRVLLRRGVLEQTGERRVPGRAGGRPAAVFRFRSDEPGSAFTCRTKAVYGAWSELGIGSKSRFTPSAPRAFTAFAISVARRFRFVVLLSRVDIAA